MGSHLRIDVESVLLRAGVVDAAQLRTAIAHQRRWGRPLEHAIVDLGILTEHALFVHLAAAWGVEYVCIGERVVPPEILRLVRERIARARRALPLELEADRPRGPLLVAMADPFDLAAVDEIAFCSGLAVRPLLASERDLAQAIERHFEGSPQLPASSWPSPGDGVG